MKQIFSFIKRAGALIFFSSLFSSLPFSGTSQNETNKWLFGSNTGLDFMNTPPTSISSSMTTGEGCASVANAAGSLLFYTDGSTVWNQANMVMPNGSNLGGNGSTTQSSIIVKQPGNTNIYYVFSLGAGDNAPLKYSTVDMSLAAGLGSVTTNGTLINSLCTEKLTSVKHCDGINFWVLCRPSVQSTLHAYLVSAAGVNTVPVVSTLTGLNTGWSGNMKTSPNGRLIAFAEATSGNFEYCDFDNSTGIASNLFTFPGTFSYPYGVEFSSDGTKLFGTQEGSPSVLLQWNLCAGSNQAIAASLYSVSVPTQIMGMQLASDGKIYIARMGQTTLAVINNPNNQGAACNYVHNGLVLTTGMSQFNLPNFITSFFKSPPPPFTYTTTGCQTASFTIPSVLGGGGGSGCTSFPTYTSVVWDFGDPASGSNTSTLPNPVHNYSQQGTYQPRLIIYYPCTSDTIKLPVTISGVPPILNVAGTFTICKGQTKTYAVNGADTYSWSSGPTTTVISLSPTSTSVYTVTGTSTVTGCKTSKTFTVMVSQCLGIEEPGNYLIDDLKIYPNPVSGIMNVDTKKELRLVIYDPLGSIAYDKIIYPGKSTLDVSQFSNGVYLVKIVDGAYIKFTKFIKTD